MMMMRRVVSKMGIVVVMLLWMSCMMMAIEAFVALPSRILVHSAYQILSSECKAQSCKMVIRPSQEEVDASFEDREAAQHSYILGTTFHNEKKRKGDGREYLPFVVTSMDLKIPRDIGTFMLEPSTACGDFLDLGTQGTFKVIRVRFLYTFTNGKHRVYKKKLDVMRAQPTWMNTAVSGSLSSNSRETTGLGVGDILQ